MDENKLGKPFLQKESYPWHIMFLTEAVLIMFINCITIITFHVNKQSFQRTVRYMLSNLSVADLFYGFSLAGISSVSLILTGRPPESIKTQEAILETLAMFETLALSASSASWLCLVFLAVEKAFAMFAPFVYRIHKLKYAVTVIVLVSLFSLCIGASNYFTPKMFKNILGYFYATCIISGLVTIIASYTAVIIKLRSQRQQANRISEVDQQRERHMAYILIVVTLCSLLTWLPIGIVFVVMQQRSNLRVSSRLPSLAFMVQASNSLINPVIFLVRWRDFRQALFRLLCRCVGNRVHTTNE